MFSKDTVVVGSLQGFAHLFNWKNSPGLEGERVESLLKDLSQKDNLKIVDEIQNAFINQQEAIVGTGDTDLFPSYFKYREAVEKIESILPQLKETDCNR